MSAFHSNCTNDYIPELSKTSFLINYELYKIDGDKELTLVEYLNEIALPISNITNKKEKEEYNFKIQFSIGINFVHDMPEICIFHIRSDSKKINKNSDATKKQINLSNLLKKIITSFYQIIQCLLLIQFMNSVFMLI